jgi:hypothetical protein
MEQNNFNGIFCEMNIKIQRSPTVIILKNSNRQRGVMCELKREIRQQGRVRRANETEMWKGYERNHFTLNFNGTFYISFQRKNM